MRAAAPGPAFRPGQNVAIPAAMSNVAATEYVVIFTSHLRFLVRERDTKSAARPAASPNSSNARRTASSRDTPWANNSSRRSSR